MVLQARLKPFDPERGNLRRGLTISSLGLAFDAGVIVSGITPHQANALRKIRQRDEDVNSPLAFDVLEEAEMKRLIASEARQKLGLSPDQIQAVVEDMAAQAAEQPTASQPAPVRRRRGSNP